MARELPPPVQAANSQIKPHTSVSRDPRCPLVAFSAVWLLAAGPTPAAELRIQPTLTVSETYTDNVDLVAPGFEKSDFITQINPGVSVRMRGGRSEASLDYILQTLIYARDSNRNTVNNLLAANGKAELVDNFLFIDGSASITQQNISLLGPLGVDTGSDTANRTEARTYAISPFIRDRFGTFADFDARYKHDYVSGSSGLVPSQGDTVNVSLLSGSAFGRGGWAIKYFNEKIDYKDLQDTSRENISAELRYALNPRFALLATTGYEDNDFATTGVKPKGSLWSAGFSWRPSSLTTLTATTGERFFGRTYFLDFSHQSRRFVWNARYGQEVSSTRQQLAIPATGDTFSYLDQLASGTIKDPVERARFVNDFINSRGLSPTLFSPVNFFTNRSFLEKRGDASVTYSSGKTVFILNAFRVDRDVKAVGGLSGGGLFPADDFNTSANIVQSGVGFVVNWRLAPKTQFDINIGTSDTLFRDTDREDTLRFVRMGLRHQFQPKISGSLDYRHLIRDSNVASAEYREDAIVGAVNIRF